MKENAFGITAKNIGVMCCEILRRGTPTRFGIRAGSLKFMVLRWVRAGMAASDFQAHWMDELVQNLGNRERRTK
jgi:hypothetical protein